MRKLWNVRDRPICKQSGLLKTQCPHCSKRSTKLSPRYELRFGTYNESPIVEILKDGGPVHPYDRHFQFGTQKGSLLLGVIPVLKEFILNTDNYGKTSMTSRELRDATTGAVIKTWIEFHEEFIWSTGATIRRPWLHIMKLPDGPDMGVGVQKAKAICALEEQLRAWIKSP